MVLNRFRASIAPILERLAEELVRLGATSNLLSAIALTFGAIAGVVFSLGMVTSNFYLSGIVLTGLSALLDALDGAVARLTGSANALGAFFDSVGDRMVEMFVFSGLIVGGLVFVPNGLFFVLSSVLISYSRARSESLGIDMSGVGLMERAERVVIVLVALTIGYFSRGVMNALVLVGGIFNSFTVIQRTVHVASER